MNDKNSSAGQSSEQANPPRLQVWWIPQVPMKAFTVDVDSVAEGAKLLDVLARYDMFQLEHNVKPDFCNAGGLNQWSDNVDGEGTPGWESWYCEETGEDDPKAWLAAQAEAAVQGGAK